MRTYFLIITGLLTIVFCKAQGQSLDTVSLRGCYAAAKRNHPTVKQYALIQELNRLKTQSVNALWQPQISLGGQATWQSDVTQIALDFSQMKVEIPGIPPGIKPKITGPEFPEIPKDQYKLSLDVTQTIYDGGLTRYQKKAEQFSSQAEAFKVQMEMLKVNESISQVYFSLLFYRKNLEIFGVAKAEIKNQLNKLSAQLAGGLVFPAHLNVLKAELLKTEQQMNETENQIQAGIAVLNELTGLQIQNTTTLLLPEPPAPNTNVPGLTEQQLSFQSQQLEYFKKISFSRQLPRLYGFGQVGYGRPALNMFEENFDDYYLVGLKLNWTLWNGNQFIRDRQILQLQQEGLKIQQQTALLNKKIAEENILTEIRKLRLLIQTDDEIISLRKEISATAATQLQQGVITPTAYMTELNAETQARISRKLHEIQLLQAIEKLRLNAEK